MGSTDLHVVQKYHNLDVFQGILNWAKRLTRDEVKKLLLATEMREGRCFMWQPISVK